MHELPAAPPQGDEARPANPPLTAARLQRTITRLTTGLLERDTPARLALLAALAGEHLLLIGPPGTAKSELARRLHKAFADAPYFERLLTRFSTPEELFGPLSLQALEQDRYERLTAGFLPTAGIAFLDEVFKANSAILNALLTLLNERAFDNGAGRVAAPLVCVVAASNEVPTDEALAAFHDRFLLRQMIAPVSDPGFAALLRLPADGAAAADAGIGANDDRAAEAITAAERAAIATAAADVSIGDDAIDACIALRAWLAERQLALSDRRWRRWLGLMRTIAATEGRARVDRLDLWLAPYVAAPQPALAPLLAQWFELELMQARPQQAPWLTRAVQAFEKQLEIETTLPSDDDPDGAGKLAIARAIGGPGPRGPVPDAPDLDDPLDAADDGRDGGAMPRLVSARLEDARRRRWSTVHIATRVAQVDALLGHLALAREPVAAQAAELARQLAGRLWLPPDLAQRMSAAHEQTLALIDGLVVRLAAARQGYAALPVDDTSTAAVTPLADDLDPFAPPEEPVLRAAGG
jgi:MoxR-like ATPase